MKFATGSDQSTKGSLLGTLVEGLQNWDTYLRKHFADLFLDDDGAFSRVPEFFAGTYTGVAATDVDAACPFTPKLIIVVEETTTNDLAFIWLGSDGATVSGFKVDVSDFAASNIKAIAAGDFTFGTKKFTAETGGDFDVDAKVYQFLAIGW